MPYVCKHVCMFVFCSTYYMFLIAVIQPTGNEMPTLAMLVTYISENSNIIQQRKTNSSKSQNLQMNPDMPQCYSDSAEIIREPADSTNITCT